MSLFLKATQSSWYREFLMPVVENIINDSSSKRILDIGTGPGRLPELLNSQDASLLVTGIDINIAFIDEARRNLKSENISFLYQTRNAPLEFLTDAFDMVTLCSVLFLVEDSTKSLLLREALRVLKPGGKLIVLTPTGRRSFVSAFKEMSTFAPSSFKWTFPVWRIATSLSGRKWQRQNWLNKYAVKEGLEYSKSLVFNNNATIEIITNH